MPVTTTSSSTGQWLQLEHAAPRRPLVEIAANGVFRNTGLFKIIPPKRPFFSNIRLATADVGRLLLIP